MIPTEDIIKALPLIVIGIGILAGLVIEMFFPKQKTFLAWFSAGALLITAYISLFSMQEKGSLFNDMLSNGSRAHLFYFILNFSAAIVVLFSLDYLKKAGINYGEFYILTLSAVLGMMLISSAKDLVMIFIGLEQMSICFYVLAGMRRKDVKSNESALKYFLLGSFASGFVVYGMALIYGASATFNIGTILKSMDVLKSNPLFLTGSLLFIIGFTFKIAAVPFHMWVPDVYQGAPTNVTALMSTAGKTAAFGALISFLAPFIDYSSFVVSAPKIFVPFLQAISALSMLYGAVTALSQENVKRMLAYSSIAHAGYMLIGLSTMTYQGVQAVMFYLIAYTFMNLGAFGIISIFESSDGKYTKFSDYAGLGSKSPVMAGIMALFMFALAGLPPFAGFFGKYFVFMAALQSGMVWLAVLGAISSIISVYFYLRIIVLMYFQQKSDDPLLEISPTASAGIVIVLVLFISMSIFPGKFESLIVNLGLLTN